ncbi:hypothetical protein GKE82_01425 [Conexibacter sp. W3-3-2]|uniref:hypothetical protein n=1 Tax=Conexibacter sp. W3-3-2 TaxID=2675227 RepID=UPI0012B8257F|nr:hypothetical protein [Conexibacter sp. W3-3-2]MTD42999.1 hypothetical protein [Conexibacter sp. W3-3-2]
MLELSGHQVALIDEPLDVRLRGLGEVAAAFDDEDDLGGVLWRARLRDDDGRVWRAAADAPEHLPAGLAPSKPGTGRVPALGSLHPVRLDVHAEAPDGRGAKRTFERRLLADGVRVRRWKEPQLRGTAFLPPPDAPAAEPLLLDARIDASTGELGLLAAFVAPLAAAVLASRGRATLVVTDLDDLAPALERLAGLRAATGAPRVLRTLGAGDVVLLPPGIPVLDEGSAARTARRDRWASIVTPA